MSRRWLAGLAMGILVAWLLSSAIVIAAGLGAGGALAVSIPVGFVVSYGLAEWWASR